MKKLLLSFQPYWVEKIMNGEKYMNIEKDFVMNPLLLTCMLAHL